jgi:hypothetical protein
VIFVSTVYFVVLEWVNVEWMRKLRYGVLWLMLGIPGVWWVDLQVDGVRRGYVILPYVFTRLKRSGGHGSKDFS